MYELASKILHTELRLRAELSYYTLPPLRRVAGRGSYDHDVRAGYLPGGRGSWEMSPGSRLARRAVLVESGRSPNQPATPGKCIFVSTAPTRHRCPVLGYPGSCASGGASPRPFRLAHRARFTLFTRPNRSFVCFTPWYQHAARRRLLHFGKHAGSSSCGSEVGERFSCRPLPGRDDAARGRHTTRSVTRAWSFDRPDLRRSQGHKPACILWTLCLPRWAQTSDRGRDRP